MMMQSRLLALVLLTFAALPMASAAEPDDDLRHHLAMTPAERGEFLAEMRQMLTSIQDIITGIGTEDRERIAAAARYSGNRMARATPDSLRQRLPREFQEIGGPTHMLFEEIAIRAETDDMADLAVLTGQTLQQCLACHAMFRAD